VSRDAELAMVADPTQPAETTAADLISLKNVCVRYNTNRSPFSRAKSEILAADRVNLSISRGRSLGLVGGSGSGKSTIAKVVMGMVKPTDGIALVDGHPIGQRRTVGNAAPPRLVQIVPQDPYSSLDPRMNIGNIIAEPMTLGRPFMSGAEKARARSRVAELLDLVGLRANRAERYPHQFSGGQRQRIAIARALAASPKLIVLDEPTSALDVSVRAQILTLLNRLHEELDITYLVISHDLVTVAYLASDVAVMHLGRIVEFGPTTAMYRTPRHPYTAELIASTPGGNGGFLSQQWPAADLRDAFPARACRYAYRCGLRSRLHEPARCLDEDPALRPDGPNHFVACHFSDAVVDLTNDTHDGPHPE